MTELEDLERLLTELPPSDPTYRPNLFSISGFPHDEEVLSHWYAFFMDPNGPHQLGTLFLDALLRIASRNTQTSVSTGMSMVVRRELSTPDGSRIDLVIHDGEETNDKTIKANNAIIIENKVYHHLNNPLEQYWKTVVAEEKLGVVLSLKTMSTGHEGFTSITHRELLSEVVAQLQITHPIPEPYRQYLIDLHQNITELTAHMKYSKEVEFYLKNAVRIRRARKLEETLKAYLKSQLEVVAENMGVQLVSRANDYWYLRNSEDRAYYTILLDRVLEDGSSLDIVIELRGKPAKTLADFAVNTGDHHSPAELRRGSNWIQYAKIEIPMSEAAHGEFSNVVLRRIKEDLAPILATAKEFLRTHPET